MIKLILIHNLIYLEHVGKWLISRSPCLSPQIPLKPPFPGISQIGVPLSPFDTYVPLVTQCFVLLTFLIVFKQF